MFGLLTGSSIIIVSSYAMYNIYHKWMYPEFIYLPFDDHGSSYLLLEYPMDHSN